MNEKRTFSSIFDEDSDSSVSLLLDENEVRDVVDKDFDSVKIPACFIPNADMSKGKHVLLFASSHKCILISLWVNKTSFRLFLVFSLLEGSTEVVPFSSYSYIS